MYGYLSAPGGGVGGACHCARLQNYVEFTYGEAQLYCYLTRGYITFLLNEYERLQRL